MAMVPLPSTLAVQQRVDELSGERPFQKTRFGTSTPAFDSALMSWVM